MTNEICNILWRNNATNIVSHLFRSPFANGIPAIIRKQDLTKFTVSRKEAHSAEIVLGQTDDVSSS